MKIETGTPESHEGSGATPLPLDGSQSPALAGLTATFPSATSREGNQGGVRDLTGERLAQLAADAADIAAAQQSGMGNELGRRQHFASDVLPMGAAYGDAMTLPEVPAYSPVPPGSSLYVGPGDEPVPAG
jgi:hypothetical protein